MEPDSNLILPNIKLLTFAELQAFLHQHGEAAYRAEQIWHWLYDKWINDFDEMRNLPTALRQTLQAEFRAFSLRVKDKQSATDGTVKWLCELGDGLCVETVLIRSGKRNTVCISTQVGCQVRCVFCASGKNGLKRNLQSCEIIDQVLLACQYLQEKVSNIVVMGMGEPLHNLENLLPALELLCSAEAFGLSARNITISTSGIVPGIKKLAELQRPWNLAISLHATNEEQRRQLIPDAQRYPIEEILAACQYHSQRCNRMPTLEYALLQGFNDSAQDAARLARLAKKLHAKINLIPCNPGPSKHRAPTFSHCQRFQELLRQAGAKATLRVRKGDSIQAACGQLQERNQ